jgi:peptidoglycan/LPS O-acetylase OafA/YrhL
MKREKFSASRYFAQRLTRIFPLLVVCVLIAGLIEWNIKDSPYRPQLWTGRTDSFHFWVNMVGGGGFLGKFGSIAPAYTISYELLYYLVWGISRFLAGERVVLALVMNVCFALGYCILPAEYVGTLPAVLGAVFKQFILLIYLPWLIGAGTAIYLERLAANPIVGRIANWGWLIIFFVVLIGGKGFGMPAFKTTFVSLIYYIILGISFSLLIIRAHVRHVESFETKWKRLLGEISYPLFLIHGPIIVLVGYLINSQAITLPFFAHLSLLMVGALMAASVLVITIERPVMRLRSQYFNGTPAA